MPIPPVYFCEEQHFYEVIDGQQRLTTINNFLNNEFMLKGLVNLEHLNGLYYKDLSITDQRHINNFCFKVNIIKSDDINMKYDMFKRLNTGSTALRPQEIRNCIYRGNFNDMLKSMAKDEKIKFAMWLDSVFKHNVHHTKHEKGIAANIFMEKHKNMDKEKVEYVKEYYTNKFINCYKLFGSLFHNVSDRYLILDIYNSYSMDILLTYKNEILEVINDMNENDIEYISKKVGRQSGTPNVLRERHKMVKDRINSYLGI